VIVNVGLAHVLVIEALVRRMSVAERGVVVYVLVIRAQVREATIAIMIVSHVVVLVRVLERFVIM
jgi:hypothetical protein